MTFHPERSGDFLDNFNRHKNEIRNFPGCCKLELLQESGKAGVYFTYSWWDSEEKLEEYRNSGLFKSVWKVTKSWFADKPEAWTLIQKLEV